MVAIWLTRLPLGTRTTWKNSTSCLRRRVSSCSWRPSEMVWDDYAPRLEEPGRAAMSTNWRPKSRGQTWAGHSGGSAVSSWTSWRHSVSRPKTRSSRTQEKVDELAEPTRRPRGQAVPVATQGHPVYAKAIYDVDRYAFEVRREEDPRRRIRRRRSAGEADVERRSTPGLAGTRGLGVESADGRCGMGCGQQLGVAHGRESTTIDDSARSIADRRDSTRLRGPGLHDLEPSLIDDYLLNAPLVWISWRPP